MSALDGTEQAWLRQLLTAFHLGQIDAFNTIAAENRDAWDEQPALGVYEEQVKQKVTLLCLMNLATELPPTERTIPFATIADRTQLPVDEVRWCMRGHQLALGCMQGHQLVVCSGDSRSCARVLAAGGVVVDAGHVAGLGEGFY